MKSFASFFLAGLMVSMSSIPAQAQQRVIELGIDGGFVFTSPSIDGVETDSRFDIALPVQQLRVGFVVNNQFSVEPSLSFNRLGGNDFSLSVLGLQANGLYHLSPDRTRPQFYLQGGGGLQRLSASDEGESVSDTQWIAGAGAGVKVPLVDRLAGRFAVVYQRAFESDFEPDSNIIRGQVGFSFFTH